MGYCGTMGADYIEYVIGDDTVIPGELRTYYQVQHSLDLSIVKSFSLLCFDSTYAGEGYFHATQLFRERPQAVVTRSGGPRRAAYTREIRTARR